MMKKSIERTLWKLRVKKIKKFLNDHYFVSNCKYSCTKGGEYFFVEFIDGIKESWQIRPGTSPDTNETLACKYRTEMPTNNCIGNDKIIEFCEFESGPLDRNEKYDEFFLIRYKDLVKAPFCNCRLKIHEIISRLLKTGWVNYQFPKDHLLMEYDSLCSSKLEKYRWSLNRMYYCADKMGCRSIIEQYFPVIDYNRGNRSIREAFKEPDTLYQAINLLYKRKKNITRSNILRQIQNYPGSRRCGPKMQNPAFWMSLISNFFPNTKTILDIAPEWGGKLLASSALDIEYLYGNTSHAKYLYNVSKLIESNATELEEQLEDNMVDLAILTDIDDILYDNIVQRIIEYIDIAKNMIIIVSKPTCQKISLLFPPCRKIFFRYSTMIPEERIIMLY